MTKIIVYHNYYGCDTGCCGHTVKVTEGGGNLKEGASEFIFDHPYELTQLRTPQEFAEQMVREAFGEDHVKDLDWDNCEIVED